MTGFMRKLSQLGMWLWFCIAVAVFLVCEEIPDWLREYGTYTYTGQTVKIGEQIWMAENLNRATANSKCYGNDHSNCDKYGMLYNWYEAKKACPSGWHLPSDAEWDVLVNYIGDSAGVKLKSTSGWNDYDGKSNGTNEHGFSALPGGDGNSVGSFSDVGRYGRWWSATEGSAVYAWGRYVGYDNEGVYRRNDDKTYLFSVRCLQD